MVTWSGTVLLVTLLMGAAAAAEEQALVLREPARPLPNGVLVDHGGEVDGAGQVWVAVRADSAILDRMPASHVRARQAVRRGPPPEGASLPEGKGGDRLVAAVAMAPRAGFLTAGTSRLGRDIPGAWFGQPPDVGAPALWLLGGHHGDEVAGYEAALWMAESLAVGDLEAPAVQQALDGRTVWVVPWVNPDGVMDADRYNAGRIDLNRNYDVEWSTREPWAGETPFSEPETRALRRLGEQIRPAAGLALHSGAVNIGYVWNHTEADAPDRDGLIWMAEDYAGHCSTEDFYVTNGAAWYVTHGDSNDWAYGRYGTWEFTVELSRFKILDPQAVTTTLDEHAWALERFVLQPMAELAVVDASTGVPLEAWVVAGEGQRRWTHPTSGRVGLVGPHDAEVFVGALGYRSAVGEVGTTVPLERLAMEVRPASPEWIPAAATSVRLPGRGATRTLHKVGEDPVVVTVDRAGAARVPGGSMRSGWWTVEDAEGTVYPRAMAVGAESGDGRWPALAAGGRAYVLGAQRQLLEVEVGQEGQPLPDTAVWMVDGSGERLVVTGGLGPEEVLARGAGCASAPQTGHLGLLLVSIASAWTRRRSEERRSAEHGRNGRSGGQ